MSDEIIEAKAQNDYEREFQVRRDLGDLLRNRARLRSMQDEIDALSQSVEEMAKSITERLSPDRRYVFKNSDYRYYSVMVDRSGHLHLDTIDSLGVL